MKVRDLLDLSGRVALVTGGSRGLGLQIAHALGEMGAQIAITARKQDELDDAVAALKRSGIEAHAYVCDMAKRDAIAPMADSVLAKFGRVEILVNNAGATWGAPAEEHPLEAWDKVVRTNVDGTRTVMEAAGDAGVARVVHTSSVGALGIPADGTPGTASACRRFG